MTTPEPGSAEWLALVEEPIVDPERPIVDPHHHLWEFPRSTYLLDELWKDTGSGHNVVKTVFVDGGPTAKRFRPRSMGRANRIRKRTSHLTIVVGTTNQPAASGA